MKKIELLAPAGNLESRWQRYTAERMQSILAMGS